MEAEIVRGRIRLSFPDELNNQAIEDVLTRLSEQIGSARFVAKSKRQLSCALSPHNFRKLRVAGCRLSQNHSTRKIIAKMRAERDVYLEESKRGDRAKAGEQLVANYKFKAKPFEHQKLGFQFLHSMPNPALFGDCGTGKTFMVLAYADSLVKAGVDVVFLVVCPVNLIQHVWLEDAETFSDLKCVALREPTVAAVIGEDWDDPKDPEMKFMERAALRAERKEDDEWKSKAKRRAQARHRKKLDARFQEDGDMYIINPENLRTDAKEKRVLALCRRLRKEGKEVCLIIDESSKLKTRTSRTYKSLKKIRSLSENCIIMTGTPAPNGILDLWAQFSILDNGKTLQPSFVDFRKDTCREKILYSVKIPRSDGTTDYGKTWAPKTGAARQVHDIIKHRMIRFKTEDCIDLPPERFIIRYIDMTVEQSTFYADMEERLFAEIEGHPVTARVAVSKLMKLREVTGGFIITDQKETKPFNKNSSKMLELDRLLEQSIQERIGDEGPPKKAIIWANYKWECKELLKRYHGKYGARGLFGGISSGVKDRSIHDFKKSDDCRLLVCHPASVAHGLTLVQASYIFYYSLSYNFEEFYQSYRRTARHGQKRAMTYYLLVAPNTIDEELLDAIRSKKDLSDVVTDGEFQRGTFLNTRGTLGGQINFDFEAA